MCLIFVDKGTHENYLTLNISRFTVQIILNFKMALYSNALVMKLFNNSRKPKLLAFL